MEALYRVEMHSQAHEITNNCLKTIYYEIGINLPHNFMNFKRRRDRYRKEWGSRHRVGAANVLYVEVSMLPSALKKKSAISHLIYLDFARVRQVWKSRPDNGSGHIRYSHTNARHGGAVVCLVTNCSAADNNTPACSAA